MISTPQRDGLARLRQRIHFALDYSTPNDRLSVAVHRVLVLLVILSVTAIVVESVPEISHGREKLFLFIELAAIFIFTIEFLLRIWSAPEHTPYSEMHPWLARWHFVRTPLALVDLLSTLPLYLVLFVDADLRVLLIFRLLRFFKLARYSPGMRSLAAAIQSERNALLASGVLLIGAMLLSSSLIHLAEGNAQPDKFGTIPSSMWWAIVTLTTVGYGDVVPVTMAGRIIAGFTMVTGMLMLALPIGIVATAFSEEIHRREFVVTWGMLARVPLFSSLNASEIAELMQYLRAQTVPADTLIVRRGDPARCMYFIASGAVEIEEPTNPIRLDEGHFFGEISLLRNTQRSANVRTLQATKLLMLDAADVRALMERNPEIRESIETLAAQRHSERGGAPGAGDFSRPRF